MGWFSGADYLRLEILMDPNAIIDDDYPQQIVGLEHRLGRGAIRWQTLNPIPDLTDRKARMALVALHYGHILGIADNKTRTSLFQNMSHELPLRLSERMANYYSDKPFPYSGDGILNIIGKRVYNSWRWELSEPAEITKPKTYVSTLKIDKAGDYWLTLKMPIFGAQNILAPASVYIAFRGLWRDLNRVERFRFLRLLQAMNQFYGTAEQARGGEAGRQAFKASLHELTL
jgi:hypothetical protein